MTPDLAELRRLLDVNRERDFHALPWHAWDRGIGYELHVGATCRDEMEPRGYCEGVNNGFRETFGAPEAELIVAAVNALPTLLDRLAHMTEARDNARAEVERLTGRVEAVPEYASLRPEYASPRPDLAELRRLAEAATQGPWAARYGVSWEARVCATTGSLADVDSTANAELIAAAVNALPALLDAAAESDALAAKVERVRALPAKHPAGGWYVTSMRDVLAALDEESQP